MTRAALPLSALIVAGCMPVTSPVAPTALPPPRRQAVPAKPPIAPAPLPSRAQLLAEPRFVNLRRALFAARLGGMPSGPITVIAPDDSAWGKLAPGVLADLFKPENRGSLAALLRFHFVPGRIDLADLRRRAIAGPVRLPTLTGEPITAEMAGPALVLGDASGHRAVVIAGSAVADGAVIEVQALLVPQALGPQP